MNGVMRLGVSAGSNHVGASDTCTAYVSCPEEAAAAGPGTAAAAMATRTAKAMRRLQYARRSFMSGLDLPFCACGVSGGGAGVPVRERSLPGARRPYGLLTTRTR